MEMRVKNVRKALAFTGAVAAVNVVALGALTAAALGVQLLVAGIA